MTKPQIWMIGIGLLWSAGAIHLGQRPNAYISESLGDERFLYPLLAWLVLTMFWWGLTFMFPRFAPLWGKLGNALGRSVLILPIMGAGFMLLLLFLPTLEIIQSLSYYQRPYPELIVLGVWGWLWALAFRQHPQRIASMACIMSQMGGIIFISLFILEFLLRLFTLPANHPVQIQKGIIHLFQTEAAFGWSLRPNYHFVWASEGEFENEIQLNGLGQHDLERSYERRPNTQRVLVIGDSFVEALQVSVPQPPPKLPRSA